MKKEICWNITTKCNQECRYCHRFLKIKELSFEENNQILNKLISDGITDITWTGGEALLYKDIDKLIKKAFENGIKNKLITNGKILVKDNMKILEYLNCLTLSIDSISDDINKKLGRGIEHFDNIKYILDYIKDKNLDIILRINTVVNNYNVNNFKELIYFLNNYAIYAWRIFRFMPLRETSVKNKDEFEISDEQFNNIKILCNENSNIINTEFREKEDMEKKYVLLIANGDIIITESGKDVKKGNALYDSLLTYTGV